MIIKDLLQVHVHVCGEVTSNYVHRYTYSQLTRDNPSSVSCAYPSDHVHLHALMSHIKYSEEMWLMEICMYGVVILQMAKG